MDWRSGTLRGRVDFLIASSLFSNRWTSVIGGELLSNAQLDLRIESLDNSNGGLVSGLQGLSISADSLSNQGGELSTAANLSIQATRLDNSAAGKVIAGNQPSDAARL